MKRARSEITKYSAAGSKQTQPSCGSRNKSGSACLSCKKAKRQCKGGHPCARCQKLNIPCVAVLDRRSKAFREIKKNSKSAIEEHIVSVSCNQQSNTEIGSEEGGPGRQYRSIGALDSIHAARASADSTSRISRSGRKDSTTKMQTGSIPRHHPSEPTAQQTERAGGRGHQSGRSAVGLELVGSHAARGPLRAVSARPASAARVSAFSKTPQYVPRPVSAPQLTVQQDCRGSVLLTVRQDPATPGLATLLGPKFNCTLFVSPELEARANRRLLPDGRNPSLPHYAQQLQYAYEMHTADAQAVEELSRSPVPSARFTRNILTLQPTQQFVNGAALQMMRGEPGVDAAFIGLPALMMEVGPVGSLQMLICKMSTICGPRGYEPRSRVTGYRHFFVSPQAREEVMRFVRLLSAGRSAGEAERLVYAGMKGSSGGSSSSPSSSGSGTWPAIDAGSGSTRPGRDSSSQTTSASSSISSSSSIAIATMGTGGAIMASDMPPKAWQGQEEDNEEMCVPGVAQMPAFVAQRVASVPFGMELSIRAEWVGTAPRVMSCTIDRCGPPPTKQECMEYLAAAGGDHQLPHGAAMQGRAAEQIRGVSVPAGGTLPPTSGHDNSEAGGRPAEPSLELQPSLRSDRDPGGDKMSLCGSLSSQLDAAGHAAGQCSPLLPQRLAGGLAASTDVRTNALSSARGGDAHPDRLGTQPQASPMVQADAIDGLSHQTDGAAPAPQDSAVSTSRSRCLPSPGLSELLSIDSIGQHEQQHSMGGSGSIAGGAQETSMGQGSVPASPSGSLFGRRYSSCELDSLAGIQMDAGRFSPMSMGPRPGPLAGAIGMSRGEGQPLGFDSGETGTDTPSVGSPGASESLSVDNEEEEEEREAPARKRMRTAESGSKGSEALRIRGGASTTACERPWEEAVEGLGPALLAALDPLDLRMMRKKVLLQSELQAWYVDFRKRLSDPSSRLYGVVSSQVLAEAQ